MEIQRTVAINAPPELVWDVITDLVSAKEGAPGFEDYPFISKEWPAKASTAVWRYHAGPMKTDFRLTIVESNRGEGLQIANASRFGKGLEQYRFSHADGVTTVDYRTTSNLNLIGSLFTVFIKGRLNRQVDATVANLKKRCEMLAQRKAP